jgi:hypothetical protein
VQVAQGDLAGALKSYRDCLAIAERLAQSDPGNAGWQRDLASTTDVLPTCIVNQRIDGKRWRRCEGKAIMDRLMKLSASWKRDLAWFDQQIAALTE